MLIDGVITAIKIRQDNRNNGTMIYMAFAEQPFVSSEGVPTTER